jgi:hypothetical protein
VTLSAAHYIIKSKVTDHLLNVARRYSIALLICYPELVNEFIYNSATLVNEQGEILLNYRKCHVWAEQERQCSSFDHSRSTTVTDDHCFGRAFIEREYFSSFWFHLELWRIMSTWLNHSLLVVRTLWDPMFMISVGLRTILSW